MTESVPELFDRLAGEYDADLPFFAVAGAGLIDWLDPAAGARVLDLAAGRGAIAAAAQRRGCSVTATDAAPGMVAAMQESGLTARLMGAEQLDFPDDAFDLVTMGFALHIVPDPAAVLREAVRVLAPGGRFAFSMPTANSDPQWEFYGRTFAEFEQYLAPGSNIGRPLDGPAEFSAAGLSDIRSTVLGIDLPMERPEQVWEWVLSHGSRKFIEGLPERRRREFRNAMCAAVAGLEPLVFHQNMICWQGTASAAGPVP